METNSLNIKVESLTSNLDAIKELLEIHWAECATDKKTMVLDPDFETYKQLDSLGRVLALFAYYNDVIVGYAINFVSTHPHYKQMKVCYSDIIFLDPMFRDTSLGLRLKKQTEIEAKNIGCEVVLWSAKEGSTFSKILQRDCKVQDIIYSKKL